MYRPFRSVSFGSMLSLFVLAPMLISGTKAVPKLPVGSPALSEKYTGTINTSASKLSMSEEGSQLYSSLGLKKQGLSEKAFMLAWKGYHRMLEKGILENNAVLSICDFSQSSRKKRLYIIDIIKGVLLANTYVAHGRNSGGEYACRFSNRSNSHESSLGFYVTSNTYYGSHGLSLKLEGIEKGINDNAEDRKIVVHGSEYVGSSYLRHNRFIGRSFGCPAVPEKESKKIIHIIKDGSCLFIYHPTTGYLSKSKILNG